MFSSFEPLADKTTLGVGGAARRFCAAPDDDALRAALQEAHRHQWPRFVLGGGSNVVISDQGVDACVVSLRSAAVAFEPDGSDAVFVVADAGVTWDALVLRCAQEGLWGLECLSGIPGQVGAAPVQNIGAYGQALSDTLVALEAMPIDGGTSRWLSRESLALGYRTSLLKQQSGRRVVTRLRLRLERTRPRLQPSRLVAPPDSEHPLAVREQVLAQRAAKGMLWHAASQAPGTVGSFFLNPVVPSGLAESLQRAHPSLPTYPAERGRKLAAAWLIEQAGLVRGHVFAETKGRVALSSRHALSLTTSAGASAGDVLVAARIVASRVESCFGVSLSPEARFVGFCGATPECSGPWPPA